MNFTQRFGTLVVGVGLFGVGLVDLILKQKLGASQDILMLVAGAGVLGVHVNLTPG